MRLTEEEYANLTLKRNNPDLVEAPPTPRPSKYHNIIEECDGIRFQSKKEAKYYRELKARVFAGEVKYFLRQAPLHLHGGVKYVCDFVEFWADGSVHYVDVKGHKTEMYRVKKRLVEAAYPITIIEA